MQHALHLVELLPQQRAGGVDHVQQQVGVGRLLQGGAEGLHQLVRQVADEAHGVRQRHRGLHLLQVHRAGGGVERGEQLVGDVGVGLDQRVEQRGLAGVGVAHQRDLEGAAALARLALRATLLLDLLEALLGRLDAVADHALVELDLRLAGTAAHAGAALLAFQVAPAAHEARGQVLQASELHLQLALVALGAGREDLEDQRGAVGHAHAQVTFEVALLRGRERLVEQHPLRAMRQHQFLDLVGLAAAHEQRRIGRLAPGRDAGDGNVVRGLGQQREFVERGVEGGAAAEVHPDEDHARRLAMRGTAELGAAGTVVSQCDPGARAPDSDRTIIRARHPRGSSPRGPAPPWRWRACRPSG